VTAVLTGSADPSAGERHESGHQALVDDLRAQLATAALGGSERSRTRHVERGKLLPRDRVDALVDPSSPFLELSPLAALVEFQAAFALREPELIVVQDRDLANLPPAARRRVRLLQRTYVEIWVDTLRRVHPGLTAEQARVAAHGAFGLLNSTPHTGRSADTAALLQRMALAALTDLGA
jgi:hypothetical protein